MPMKNPPHPGGFVLRQCIEPLGVTITQAAAALGVTRTTLSELVNGKRGISPEFRFTPCLHWMFKSLRTPVVSDSPGHRRPEFFKLLQASGPPAPTDESAIFTPGPIVEAIETFFM